MKREDYNEDENDYFNRYALSLLIWLISMSQASANSLVNYSNEFTDVWKYSMIVENMDIDPLYDLKLDVGTDDLPGLVIFSPTGWTPVEIGTDFIHWMNISGEDVNLGIPKSGFYFTYTGTLTDDIGSIPYHTIIWNNINGANPICNGMTGSPSDCQSNASVPEPGTILLVLTGIMAVIMLNHEKEYED